MSLASSVLFTGDNKLSWLSTVTPLWRRELLAPQPMTKAKNRMSSIWLSCFLGVLMKPNGFLSSSPSNWENICVRCLNKPLLHDLFKKSYSNLGCSSKPLRKKIFNHLKTLFRFKNPHKNHDLRKRIRLPWQPPITQARACMFIATKGLFLISLLQQNHTLITQREELCNLILTYFIEFCHSRKRVKKYFFGEFASALIWKILIGTILQEGNA